MDPSTDAAAWIDSQADALRDLVVRWADINSGTHNLGGQHTLAAVLEEAFAGLDGDAQRFDSQPETTLDACGAVVTMPLGPVLSIRKRPEAPMRVLLGGHMDTVFPADHPFQRCEVLGAARVRGPGVADMKGGLAVMLTALRALERSSHAREIGWEVLINSDEEIGSPGSRALFEEAAARNHVGLLFEPALPGGTFARARKGSGNFAAVLRGRAVHAGRKFDEGRNALVAAARFAVALADLSGRRPGLTVNVARIEGGGPLNIVADLGICRFNVRVQTTDDQGFALGEIQEALDRVIKDTGITATLHGQFSAPPKPVDRAGRRLMDLVSSCGQRLGIPVRWEDTGGVCDGNRLAAAGLANIDTMGVRGDRIHSDQEYLELSSLTERAKLTATVLIELARGRG